MRIVTFSRQRYILLFLLLISLSIPKTSNANEFNTSLNNPIKSTFIGEIKKYSYIKVSIESTNEAQDQNTVLTPVKGTYLEARSGITFNIIGNYNTDTFIWKLDCFDKNNSYISTFLGKEDTDGNIEGTWTYKKKSYDFYLRKNNK